MKHRAAMSYLLAAEQTRGHSITVEDKNRPEMKRHLEIETVNAKGQSVVQVLYQPRLTPYGSAIKPDHSIIGLLGKLFFMHQAPWIQRRKTIVLLWSIAVGLFCGGVCAAIMFYQSTFK
jgi:hypothetical protein